MAIRALDLLVEILTAHYFKTIAIDKFVGIEESTLSTALLRVKGRGREIDDLLHFLPFAKESLTEFHHVNPVIVGPLRLVALGSAKTVVEVESVDVECYTLCHIRDIIKKKSRPRTAMSIQERMAELNNLLQRYIFYSILPNILQII